MKKVFTLLLLLALIFTNARTTKAQQAKDPRVLLQGFYWDCNVGNQWYNIITNHAQDISDAGFDMIWLPPPSKATSGMGYLPTELNNMNNNFGTQAQHQAMLNALNNLGVEPIADIVINHRAGSSNWLDFTNPTWGTNSITANDEVWSQPAYSGISLRGGNDTGENYDAARDIDHSQQWVRNEIITWLNSLKNFGYKGWRYDLVKGFNPSYIKEYNQATNPTFSVGEYYDFDKQKVQNWVDGTLQASTAFDFPTYATVKAAIRDNNYSYLSYQGAPSGLISWSPSKSTTFVENHDTPRYDAGNNVLNGNNVAMAYAYLLTHPGVPTVYWPHWNDWGVKNSINALIKVRKDNGIHSESTVSIVQSTSNIYAAIIDNKVAVKIGPGSWSPSDSNFKLVTSGNNYAVWAKNGTQPTQKLTLMWQTSIATPYLYYWNMNGTTNNPVAWPGVRMVASSSFPGWYEYTINGTSANVIFNNGQGTQTADLMNISDNDCNPNDGRRWWNGSKWVNQNCSQVSSIQFMANGGQGEMPTLVGEVGQAITLSDNTFTKDGFAFTGWSTDENGTGDFYNNGEEITPNSETINLYAQWSITTNVSKNDGSIRFYPNPAKNHLIIENNLVKQARITIFNISGTIVLDKEAGNGLLDVSHLANGIYLVLLDGNTTKLIIQK